MGVLTRPGVKGVGREWVVPGDGDGDGGDETEVEPHILRYEYERAQQRG